jgi:formamidopyrimidine-DNA glycosylase
MTGQLIYRIGEKIFAGGHSMSTLQTELPDKHTQFIITFADGSKLYFNDLRRFGYVKIVDSLELERIKKTYGIEPLTKAFTLDAFTTVLKHKKTILKAFLLNQKYLAGVGNIYADEIAHNAHLKPTRNLSTLSAHDIAALYTSIQKILAKAVKHRGTTFNNYVDSDGNKGNFSTHLKVYEQAGEPCDHCRTNLIKKTRVAGRGTYWCSECQT